MIRAIHVSLVLVSLTFASHVWAQTTKDLAGTYKLVSETREQDGTKTEIRGNDGRLVLDANGNYVLTTISNELPTVASSNRMTATSEEAKAIVAGSLTHFGTYSVEGNVLVFKVERATFANWNGIEQKRPFTLVGDELKYTLALASGGGSVTLTWSRAKSLAAAIDNAFEARVQYARAMEETRAGRAYQDSMWPLVQPFILALLQECVSGDAKPDLTSFVWVANVTSEGQVSRMQVEPKTGISNCFSGGMKNAPFPKPPAEFADGGIPITFSMRLQSMPQ